MKDIYFSNQLALNKKTSFYTVTCYHSYEMIFSRRFIQKKDINYLSNYEHIVFKNE